MQQSDFESRRLRGFIKQLLWSHCRIPFRTIYGIPTALLKHIDRAKPLKLIDIGAHQGAFTRGLGFYCQISGALLIEPQPDKANQMKRIFQPPRYQVVEGAVSSTTGTAAFHVHKYDATSSLLAFAKNMPELTALDTSVRTTFQCRTFSLDELASATGFDDAGLVKIDVQGAEHLVLQGAKRFLNQTAKIWIEISFKPLYEASATFFDVYQCLYDRGFKLVEIEPGFRAPNGELLQADALFAKV